MAAAGGGPGLKRGLTAEERALWRRVQRSVRPRPGMQPLPPEPPAPTAAAPAAPVVQRSAPPSCQPTRQPAAGAAAPADRGGEKRVRRGRLDIAAKLDLHGCTQERAHRAVQSFLHRNAAEGAGVVLVVTGQGMRLSPDGERRPGVLRARLPEWLAEPGLRPVVCGYASAHAQHGGEGAFYVFLRRLKPG